MGLNIPQNPYDQYVHNAINSQDNITNVGESTGNVHHRGETAQALADSADEIIIEEKITVTKKSEKPFEWHKGEELPPVEDILSSQILDDVGKMENWMSSVADKVKTAQSHLQDIKDQNEVVNLKDS
jgi:hypothetical protein